MFFYGILLILVIMVLLVSTNYLVDIHPETLKGYLEINIDTSKAAGTDILTFQSIEMNTGDDPRGDP